jgi:DNA helicase-2/ATP-dependent DNA helicase PcrA
VSYQTILDSNNSSIVAPAGCGKTHLITEVLAIKQSKPYLVLTHTTAGVAALKQRLNRLSIPKNNYVITTIDGWALRISRSFPQSCPINSFPENARVFYPELRSSVLSMLNLGNINELIRASYSRLFVDEYQDCDLIQHQIVTSLSQVIPTTVFGDPMQCIFDFSGVMPNWGSDVIRQFPLLMTLDIPWRWNNAGAPELGQWILNCRNTLVQGGSIDFNSCPNFVFPNLLSGTNQTDYQNQLRVQQEIQNQNPNESLLVIGDSRNKESRHKFAKSARSIQVVEPVDLGDITSATRVLDISNQQNIVQNLLQITSQLMTNIEQVNTLQRLETIRAGRNRNQVTELEKALLDLAEQNDVKAIQNAISELENKKGTRVFRKGAFFALKDSLALAASSPDKSILDSSKIIREQRRHIGDKRIPKKAIGSTLLLKGLEADHVVILDSSTMNARNLYVALSRGAKSVTVFHRNNRA